MKINANWPTDKQHAQLLALALACCLRLGHRRRLHLLTRCCVIFMGEDNRKEGRRIFGSIHQMWKEFLRIPIASYALGKAEVSRQNGNNGMQNGYVLHTVITS